MTNPTTQPCCDKCLDTDHEGDLVCFMSACLCHKSAEKGYREVVREPSLKFDAPTTDTSEQYIGCKTNCYHRADYKGCMCLCHCTDTSDSWRERFAKQFGCYCELDETPHLSHKPDFVEIEAFIEKELERVREEGHNRHVAECDKRFDAQFEASRAAAIAEVKEMVVEKIKKDFHLDDWEEGWNSALSDLLDRIAKLK